MHAFLSLYLGVSINGNGVSAHCFELSEAEFLIVVAIFHGIIETEYSTERPALRSLGI